MPPARRRSTSFTSAPFSGALAELHRNALLALTHDMVGIASAMELRLELPSAMRDDANAEALRTLTEQLRDVSRMTRLLKGPSADDALMPQRQMPAEDWWRLTARLASAIIPRGTRIESVIEPQPFTPQNAHFLCVVWLLACQGLRDAGVTRPSILLTVRQNANGEPCTVEALLAESPEFNLNPKVQRWQRYAMRVATAAGARLDWWTLRDGRVQWRCHLADEPVP